jgi:hypothetical protein
MKKTNISYSLGRMRGNASVNRIYSFLNKTQYMDPNMFYQKIFSINISEKKINAINSIMNNFNILSDNSLIKFNDISTDPSSQYIAQNIYNTSIQTTGQPYTIAPKAPLVFTKMLDKLLESIYREFVTNPKIIRLFDAFNYNNGSQMTIDQYDSIIQTCVLFWRDKNFELFKQDTKLFFNFCILDYICGKFFISYKKYVANNTNIITNVNDSNLGANGYTQWVGGYIGTRALTDSNGNKTIVFPGNYSILGRTAMDRGQVYETEGFQSKTRKFITTFSGEKGSDTSFIFLLGELNTSVSKTTENLNNGNKLETITERNAIGQTKISKTIKDINNNIISMSVDYLNAVNYEILSNINFD